MTLEGRGQGSGIGPALGNGHLLLVVPPFASLQWPSLAAHLLQACVREQGLEADVLYLNLAVASELGANDYSTLCNLSCSSSWLRESLLLESATGRSGSERVTTLEHFAGHIDTERAAAFFDELPFWLDRAAEQIARGPYLAVGCSATYAQTLASVALLRRVRQQRPGLVTMIGGAACEGVMAEGVRSLDPGLDLICSGQWETELPLLLQRVVDGWRPEPQELYGTAPAELESLPCPSYQAYYDQLDHFLGLGAEAARAALGIHLPYETSRGCWWGVKHTCRFCGLNGTALSYQEKSTDKVVAELETLLGRHPGSIVMLTDNVLPPTAPTRLLPALAERLPDLVLCAQARTHYRLPELLAMRRAGMRVLQAGVEAISSSLLRRMRKGVTARQNLIFLRDAARVGDLEIYWNLLYGFPGDTENEIRETLGLVPWMTHLRPPLLLAPLVIERFSPYFEHSDRYGLRDLRQSQYPPEYLGPEVDLELLASHFDAELSCFSRSGHPLMERLAEEVASWQLAWRRDGSSMPRLELTKLGNARYLLTDTRPASPRPGHHLMGEERARSILADHRETGQRSPEGDHINWALSQRTAVRADGWLISLVVAPIEILSELDLAPA